MPLALLQPMEDGTYLGGGAVGLLNLSVTSTSGLVAEIAKRWSTGGGGGAWANADESKATLRVQVTQDPPGQEDVIRTRLMEIQAKLETEAAGANATCSGWLQNPTDPTRSWSVFLPLTISDHMYARWIFRLESRAGGRTTTKVADLIAATVQGKNPGEADWVLPEQVLFAVNDVGAFYRSTTIDGQRYAEGGRGQYGGGNPRSQAEILLHELAHLFVGIDMMPASMRTVSFLHDFAEEGSDRNQRANRMLLDQKCGTLIRTFPHR